jgi:hypothetical protein
MLRGATAFVIVIVSDLVVVCAVGVAESVTFTAKLNVPAAVGVPAISPVEAFSANPAGRDPEARDQLYGDEPPPAESTLEYSVFTLPPGRELVTIWSGETLIVMLMDNDCLAVCTVGADESVTATTKFETPAVVGIPEIVPFADRDRPSGSVPELRDHE